MVGVDAEGRSSSSTTRHATCWAGPRARGSAPTARADPPSPCRRQAVSADECPSRQPCAMARPARCRRLLLAAGWVALTVEYTVAALLRDGKPGGAVNVFRDISVRKQNEAELAAYRHDLESLVAERRLRSTTWRPGPATCWSPVPRLVRHRPRRFDHLHQPGCLATCWAMGRARHRPVGTPAFHHSQGWMALPIRQRTAPVT